MKPQRKNKKKNEHKILKPQRKNKKKKKVTLLEPKIEKSPKGNYIKSGWPIFFSNYIESGLGPKSVCETSES